LSIAISYRVERPGELASGAQEAGSINRHAEIIARADSTPPRRRRSTPPCLAAAPTSSPIFPRDRLCRIACDRCGRAGAYRPATLAAKFGDMALPDVLIALTACERRGDFSKAMWRGLCGAAGRGAVKVLMAGLFFAQTAAPCRRRIQLAIRARPNSFVRALVAG
jgi:hypothetical protein